MKTRLGGLLIVLYFLTTAMTCEEFYDSPYYDEYVVDIEAVNLDNTKEYPVIAGDSVKKEAYVIGLRCKITMSGDVNDTIYNYASTSTSTYPVLDISKLSVFCNTDFNEEYPRGSDITNFFVTLYGLNRKYDELLLLRTVPQKGAHSFTIRYRLDSCRTIQTSTELINFY